MVEWITLAISIAAGMARNVAGWLEAAWEDKKIDEYEWKQLISTTFRVALISLGVTFGFDVEPIAAATITVVGDYVYNIFRKLVRSWIER